MTAHRASHSSSAERLPGVAGGADEGPGLRVADHGRRPPGRDGGWGDEQFPILDGGSAAMAGKQSGALPSTASTGPSAATAVAAGPAPSTWTASAGSGRPGPSRAARSPGTRRWGGGRGGRRGRLRLRRGTSAATTTAPSYSPLIRTIITSTFTGDHVLAAAGGTGGEGGDAWRGAIKNENGTVTLRNSSITGNVVGGGAGDLRRRRGGRGRRPVRRGGLDNPSP
jgi:hypothetical protein